MSEQFKPFFVHYNRPVMKDDPKSWMHAPRGFTAYVEPTKEPRMVQMRAVLCSAQEKAFVKSTGRVEVMNGECVTMNAREVGAVLEELKSKCDRSAPEKGAYNYIFKYML